MPIYESNTEIDEKKLELIKNMSKINEKTTKKLVHTVAKDEIGEFYINRVLIFSKTILSSEYLENVYKTYYHPINKFFEKYGLYNLAKNNPNDAKIQLNLEIIMSASQHYIHMDTELYLEMKKIFDIETEAIDDKKQNTKVKNIGNKYDQKIIDEINTLIENGTNKYEASRKVREQQIQETNDKIYQFYEAIYTLSERDISIMAEMIVKLYETTKTLHKINTEKLVSLSKQKENTLSNIKNHTKHMPQEMLENIIFPLFIEKIEQLCQCTQNTQCEECIDSAPIYYCYDCDDFIDENVYNVYKNIIKENI